MNAKQSAKRGMFASVMSHCLHHPGIIGSIPSLQTSFYIFQSKYTDLITLQEEEAAAAARMATGKDQVKEKLAKQFSTAAGIMFASGFNRKSISLMEVLDAGNMLLARKGQKNIVRVCSNMLNEAMAMKDQMAAHGLDEKMLLPLGAVLKEYKSILKKTYRSMEWQTQDTNSNKISYGRQIALHIDDIDRFLQDTLDKEVMPLKISAPEFADAYFFNRSIVEPGNSKTKLLGTIRDSVTGKILEGATIKVIYDSGIQYGMSNARGNYEMRMPQPGTFRLEVSHPQYITNDSEEIEVILGKNLRLNIMLIMA